MRAWRRPVSRGDELAMWTIFASPRDYPGKYVLRRFLIGPDGCTPDAAPLAVVDSLVEARRALPRGLFRQERDAADSPSVVETWF
jgi:hypothetical protein